MPELVVSQSKIKTWRRCHKAYYYRYVEGLDPKRQAIPPLRGTIIHECLDAIVAKKPWERVVANYAHTYAKLFEEEKQEYGNIPEEVSRIVRNYELTYSDDGLIYTKGPDGNKSEIVVRAELAKGIVFQGHIDKLPMDSSGKLWIMDHKTHKVFPDESARFADLQTAVYTILLPKAGGEKPDGVLWDYIRTKAPTIPEQLKNGELTRRKNLDTDYLTYLGEIKRLGLNPAHYREELERARQNVWFQRVYLPKPNASMVKQVEADLVATAKEIQRMPDTARSLSKECNWCSYYSVCQAELRGLDAEFVRKAEYKVIDIKEIR